MPSCYRILLPLAATMLLAADVSWAQSSTPAGSVIPFAAETPHPYPAGAANRPVVWTQRIQSANATFIRLHFTKFDLAAGDSVTVRNPDGSQVWTYTGQGPHGDGEFWAFAVDGSTAIVEVHAGVTRGHGFKIEEIGHGTVELKQRKKTTPVPEVVCGTNGNEDIVCHNETLINSTERAVARLLFLVGRTQYLCTGWLVAGSNANTMLTNNHCFDTQTEVRTVQASFNYQTTSCGGSTVATTTDYAGNLLLKTNTVNRKGSKGGLDYTLFTLSGNPEATWGEITPTSRTLAVDQQIWVIQHPDGGLKKIGYYEDAAHTQLCKVNTINQTYGQSAAGTQLGYGCDTAPGSSGSPVLSALDGKAIGLHHYGDIAVGCLNSGTQMRQICADAGTLLSCSN